MNMKKNFSENANDFLNPTLNFLSVKEDVKNRTQQENIDEQPIFEEKEVRNKRMQILVSQKTFDKLEDKSKELKVSKNEIINRSIEILLKKI